MKIKSIQKTSNRDVYDITVEDAEHYILENGVVSHNSGPLLSANTVFFITKAQEKEGTDLKGFQFTLIAEKSRFIKEKAKIPIKVFFDTGVSKYSGLLQIALVTGDVIKPKNGWYQRVLCDPETGEVIEDNKNWRAKDTDCADFWEPLLKTSMFKKNIEKMYKLSSAKMFNFEAFEFEEEV